MTMYLFDTNLLLWAAAGSRLLPVQAARLMSDDANLLLFSPLAIVEVAIKTARGKADFDVDAALLRESLLAERYVELPLTSAHAARLIDLPSMHKDPFDWLLVAQAIVEGVTLVTSDLLLGRYSGRVMVV